MTSLYAIAHAVREVLADYFGGQRSRALRYSRTALRTSSVRSDALATTSWSSCSSIDTGRRMNPAGLWRSDFGAGFFFAAMQSLSNVVAAITAPFRWYWNAL